MVAGPEVNHLLSQYEADVQSQESEEQTIHHEQRPQAQKTFMERVNKLSNCLQDLGNPFEEEGPYLYAIDTRDIANQSSAELLQTYLKKGQTKAQDFAQSLQENPTTFYDPIKRNRVDFFGRGTTTLEPSTQTLVKEDCQLFSKLFISCQSRECDLQEFFKHENHPYPAALSDGGKLYSCQKSQLASILETYITLPDQEPDTEVIIVDGAALVHTLPPTRSKTFEDYAALDILPCLCHEIQEHTHCV